MARNRPLPTDVEIKAARELLIRERFEGLNEHHKTRGHPRRQPIKDALNLLARAGHKPPTAAEIKAAHAAPVEA
jgi:hypothetical protein